MALFQVGSGAVLILTDSEFRAIREQVARGMLDYVEGKKAVVVTVPDDSTTQERIDAYRALREARNV